MIERLYKADDWTLGQCFRLLNKNFVVEPFKTFCNNFNEGLKLGEIYIEEKNGQIGSYAKGIVADSGTFKYFQLKHIASEVDWVDFLKRIFLMQGETFEYVAGYKTKTGSFYMAKINIPETKFEVKKIRGRMPRWAR